MASVEMELVALRSAQNKLWMRRSNVYLGFYYLKVKDVLDA